MTWRMLGLRAWGAIVFGICGIAIATCAACSGDDSEGTSGNASRTADAGAADGSSGSIVDGSVVGADSGARPPSGAFVIHETFNAMTTAAAPASPWTIAE